MGLKRAYTMSDSKKDQLVKARARALELRTALNAIKPPKVKPVKVKKPSKMEIEISKIKEQTEEPKETESIVSPVTPKPVEVTEPVPLPVKPVEPKQKVFVKKLKTPQNEPPITQRKAFVAITTPTPPPPPSFPPVEFRRNAFVFFVI